MSDFLELPELPCPKCDIGASAVMASDRGVAAQNHLFLVTVQKTPIGQYKALVGIGSLSQLAKSSIEFTLTHGLEVLELLKYVFDPKNEVAIKTKLTH